MSMHVLLIHRRKMNIWRRTACCFMKNWVIRWLELSISAVISSTAGMTWSGWKNLSESIGKISRISFRFRSWSWKSSPRWTRFNQKFILSISTGQQYHHPILLPVFLFSGNQFFSFHIIIIEDEIHISPFYNIIPILFFI